MQAFNLYKKFRFIFIPARSLSHLHGQEEIEACFDCVKQQLAENGRFLIDALLSYNGVQIEYKYGDHDEKLFSKDPKKQLIICRVN